MEDNKIREYVKKKLYVAGVSKVLIERAAENKLRVIILTAKPGMVIGRSGDGIDVLKADLKKLTKKDVEISIEEVRRSELDAQLTAESVAQALDCLLYTSIGTRIAVCSVQRTNRILYRGPDIRPVHGVSAGSETIDIIPARKADGCRQMCIRDRSGTGTNREAR